MRKSRVIRSALTPALSPRRGSAIGGPRILRALFSASAASDHSHRISRIADTRPLATNAADVSPSPGGEGRGEGGPFFTNLALP
jgi:hypothetical protein